MKYLFTAIYVILFSAFSYTQTIESHFVNFDFDSFTLNENAEKEIKEISSLISNEAEYSLEIIGHTDQDGSSSYNQILADQRAKEVVQFMLEQGIPSNKINYTSFGEQNLLSAKNDDLSKSKNRRVEIISKITEINTLEDLISLLTPGSPKQGFIINLDEETTINGKEGSTIIIPQDAFIFEDGTSPDGPIKVEIIESFNFNSFAKNGLSCNSGDQILESGGMMKITATSGGKDLNIRDGKDLAVSYPTTTIKKDMQLFYAEPQATGASNWIVAESEIETDFVDKVTTTEIDMSQFVGKIVQKPIFPRKDFKRIPSKPRYPSKPNAPYKPNEPIKENINLKLTNWQKLSMNSAKKEAKLDVLYNEEIAKYEQKLERYNTLQGQYEKALINHQLEIRKTDQKIKGWEELCRIKYSEIYQYQTEMQVYNQINKIWFAQMNFLRKGELKNDEKTFWAFFDLVNRKLNPNDIRIRFKKVFGPKYKNTFNEIPDIGKHCRTHRDLEKNPNYILASEIERKSSKIGFELGFLNQDKLSANSLGSYVMTVSKMGWINCDRFLRFPTRERMQIALVHEKDTKFFLIFHDMKSMLSAKEYGQIYKFNDIPNNQKVTVVGLQVIDNQPYLFSKDLTTTENLKLAPTFKKSSVAEISHIFSKLDEKAG